MCGLTMTWGYISGPSLNLIVLSGHSNRPLKSFRKPVTNSVYVALAKAEQGSNIFSFDTATQEHPHGNVDWNSFRNPILKDVKNQILSGYAHRKILELYCTYLLESV